MWQIVFRFHSAAFDIAALFVPSKLTPTNRQNIEGSE